MSCQTKLAFTEKMNREVYNAFNQTHKSLIHHKMKNEHHTHAYRWHGQFFYFSQESWYWCYIMCMPKPKQFPKALPRLISRSVESGQKFLFAHLIAALLPRFPELLKDGANLFT